MLTGGYLPRYNNVTIMIRKKNDCKSNIKKRKRVSKEKRGKRNTHSVKFIFLKISLFIKVVHFDTYNCSIFLIFNFSFKLSRNLIKIGTFFNIRQESNYCFTDKIIINNINN